MSKRSPISLKTAVIAWATTFGVLMVLAIGGQVWTAVSVRDAHETLVREMLHRTLAREAKLALYEYQRRANLELLGIEQPVELSQEVLEEELRRSIERLREHASGEQEAALMNRTSAKVDEYLQTRRALRNGGIPVAEAVRRTQPEFNAIFADLRSLRLLSDQEVAAALAQSERRQLFSDVASAGVTFVLLLALISAVFFILRAVILPTQNLEKALSAFHDGDTDARAEAGGVRETRRLAEAFNTMAEALADRRRQQLTFLAGIAHDLRNPLSALKIAVHALGQGQSQASETRLHALADRQLDRVSRMVDDLLDSTRIEAGHLELELEVIDLRDAVDDIVRLFGPTSPDHTILVEAPTEPVLVEADAHRVEQVISNLLSNAIKFSPGGSEITIEVESHEGEAMFAVTDHGIGIAEEDIATLFAPFRRRRPEVAPGAGLGLSVVRHIVSAHRGSIEVDSEIGKGATFRVKLPLAKQNVAGEPPPSGRDRAA